MLPAEVGQARNLAAMSAGPERKRGSPRRAAPVVCHALRTSVGESKVKARRGPRTRVPRGGLPPPSTTRSEPFLGRRHDGTVEGCPEEGCPRRRERVSSCENAPGIALARRFGLGPTEIAEFLFQQRKDMRKKAREQGKPAPDFPRHRPSPAAVCRALKHESHNPAKRKKKNHRPRKTTRAEDRKLATVTRRLEKHNGPLGRDVSARMIRAEWKTRKKVSVRTVYRRNKTAHDLKPRRNVRKARLDGEAKAARAEWGRVHKRITKEAWRKHTLVIDEKKWVWNTTAKARRAARQMRKKKTWRTRKEGILYCSPDKFKHRQGVVGYNVLMGVGNGKMRVWETGWPGTMTAEIYATFVYGTISVAMAAMQNETGVKPTLLRDNAPQSHDTYKGLAAESGAGLKVVTQPTGSPDLNADDYTFWKAIEDDMLMHEIEWEESHPGEEWVEKREDWEARLKSTARRVLAKAYVDRSLMSMKRRCTELERTGGEWVKGD